MVDYTTTAKWGEAPTPPYSHIYIDTYNLIQHTPTKSVTATMFLFEKPSSLHLLFCFVEGYGEQLHVCVHVVFFVVFFHHPHCRDNAWSMEFKFRERQRDTHTQRKRTLPIHLLALNRKSDKQKVPGYQSQHTGHLVNDAANTTSPVRGEIWQ